MSIIERILHAKLPYAAAEELANRIDDLAPDEAKVLRRLCYEVTWGNKGKVGLGVRPTSWYTGVGERRVRAAFNSLEAKGLIAPVGGPRGRKAGKFELLFEEMERQARSA